MLLRHRAALLGLACSVATSTYAFTLETTATVGCHERIAIEAMRRSGFGATVPVSNSADETLKANLPFTLPTDWNSWMLAALVGDRNNDLHGGAITDLVVHPMEDYSDEDQRAHCLRAEHDEGTTGDVSAVANCRAFILGQLAIADAASDAELETQGVALRFENAQVAFPKRAYHLGSALHALQDSFAHTYRSNDFHQVLTVFNYVAPVLEKDYQESRDGHAHQSTLDSCAEETQFGSARQEAAIAAGADLLAASNSVRAGSSRDVEEAALDKWLTLQSGCDASNSWCDAESRYSVLEKTTGCQSAPGDVSGGIMATLVGMWQLGRRRRTSL